MLTEGRKNRVDSLGRIVEGEDRIYNDLDSIGNIHGFPVEKPEVPAEIQRAILGLKTVKIR